MKAPQNELNYELFDLSLIETNTEMQFFQLEELIFSVDNENIDKCVKIILENYGKMTYKTIISLIYYVSEHRPFSWPFLAKIVEKLPPPPIPLKPSNFIFYLVKSGSIPEKYCRHRVLTQMTAEEIEGEYPRWSLERNIRDDDVERVIFLASEPGFHRTKMVVKDKEVSLISAAAYYSAVKCFKYLMMNVNEFNYELSEFAIMGGNPEILGFCKQNGCFFKGCLPLAIEYHRNDVAKWILKEFGLEPITIQQCLNSYNTLAMAFLCTNKFYVTEKTSSGVTPIMIAAELCRAESVRYMAEHGGKITSKDKDGVSVLHRAAKNGCVEIIEYTLDKGVNVDDIDKERNTPLLYAASKKQLEAIKLLIKRGANVNKRNKEHISPLHRAMKNSDLGIVNILLDSGANVNESFKGGMTPLIYAAENGEIAILQTLIDHGADINACDSKGMTAMMYAAEEWYLEIIRILIKHGADTKLKDFKGKTASQHTYSDEIKELLRISA